MDSRTPFFSSSHILFKSQIPATDKVGCLLLTRVFQYNEQ